MTKRTNSFKLLWQAVKEARQSMWVSLQVLIIITIVLAAILYFAERSVQSEDYDYWNSLTWSFTRYIDDPAEVMDSAPVSSLGKIIGSIIGIIGILLFAVPAGIIGGAFNNAIDNDIRIKHLEEVGNQLQKAFKRKQESKTMFKVVPRYLSIGTLQASKQMTEQDIIDAVKHNPPYRLRNLATAMRRGSFSTDQLVVEMFPKNTDYGCLIDRGSDITIACPTAVSEASIGNFTYYLALIGGFNFISKEIEQDVDAPTSYYIISDEDKNEQLAQYLGDLRRLASGKSHWTIFIISSESKKEADVHFVTKANANTGREYTVIDQTGFEKLWNKISTDLQEQYDIKSDLNELRPVGPKNIAVLIGGGDTTNAFTIRIFSELLVLDTRYLSIAKTLATDIAISLGDSNVERMTEPSVLKSSGFGYK